MNNKPLALKLAPKSLDDVIGQRHLVGDGMILSNLVKNKKLFSMILYGKPGIGKTSIANAIVNDLGERYRFLNATTNTKTPTNHNFFIIFDIYSIPLRLNNVY